MSRSIKEVNDEINKLHHTLLNQLQKSNIVYIDLLMYYRELERLKMEREMRMMDVMSD